MAASFRISAFGDEIADDLQTQLATLTRLDIRWLELRGVWGRNVLELSDEEVASIGVVCGQAGINVSAIGSPIGKSPLEEPELIERDRLDRAFAVADQLGVSMIRVFSYYPPEGVAKEDNDWLVDKASERLATLASRAVEAGKLLVLENEKGIVGDTVERCARLLDNVGGDHLRFAWDPANFVQVGERYPTTDGWPVLGGYVGHVHIKDALANGEVQPAGWGDGEVGKLLAHLRDTEYQGFLALEPHLVVAGHSSGFSGPDGMARAASALRYLMAECGCAEA